MFTRFSPQESPERRSAARIAPRRPAAAIALAVLTAFASFAFAGCALMGGEDDPAAAVPSVVGTWVSSFGDGFSLTKADAGYQFAYVSPSYPTSNYGGIVVNEPDLTATAGYLTIHVTESGEVYAPLEGTYYVLRWEELGARGIKQGGAGKYTNGTPAPGNAGLATREDAEAELTKENGYFDVLGPYERQ